MAIFSYRELSGPAGKTVQLIHESGTKPMNVLGMRSFTHGLDFTPPAMEDCLRSLYSESLPKLRRLAPDIQAMIESRVVALAKGEMYLAQIPPGREGSAMATRDLLESLGHRMVHVDQCIPCALVPDKSGNPCLATKRAWCMAASNMLAKEGVSVVDANEMEGRPDLMQLNLEATGSVVEVARNLHLKFGDSSRITNLMEEQLLAAPNVLECSRPFLVSGRRGVELTLACGNRSAVGFMSIRSGDLLANDAAIEVAKYDGEGGWLLRGSAQEQSELVKALRKRATVDGFRSSYLQDIPETKPTPIVASDGASLTKHLLSQVQNIDPWASRMASTFSLSGITLSAGQKECVAFLASRPRAILATETGSGKTLMAAAAAVLCRDADENTLIVCPPGLIPQWIDRLYDHFPKYLEGPPPRSLGQPGWLTRLGPTAANELRVKWNAVRPRFVFLPESALQGDLHIERRRLTPRVGVIPSAQTANAIDEIDRVSLERVSGIIVDESQGYRVGGTKFEVLSALIDGRLRSCFNVKGVFLCSATPLHREATDLYPMLRLLGKSRFAEMDMAQFCDEYCQRKIVVDAEGNQGVSTLAAPYGYGMLKEEKVPEITGMLKDLMITRTKFQLAPNRSRAKIVLSPHPYVASSELGIALPGMVRSGELVRVPTEIAFQIESGEATYTKRRKLFATVKSDATVEMTRRRLEEIPPDRKIVIFSHFIKTVEDISAKLKEAGVRNHCLSSYRGLDADGRSIATKSEMAKSFIADKESRVIVMTLGAGGTGIDGLHRVSQEAIINDYSPVPGVMTQAEGRVWRIEDTDIPPGAPPARITYVLADHPSEIENYNEMIKRMHGMKFIEQQGMLQSLDSPEIVAAKEMVASIMEQRMMAIVGLVPPPRRQGIYAEAQSLAERELSNALSPEDREAQFGAALEHPSAATPLSPSDRFTVPSPAA